MTLSRRPAAVLSAGLTLTFALAGAGALIAAVPAAAVAPTAVGTRSPGPAPWAGARHRLQAEERQWVTRAPAAASAKDLGSAVGPGTRIDPGQYLSEIDDDSGAHARAVMQTDGNLVVYSSRGRAFFATHTSGHPGAYAVFQTDGNLVVYSAARVPLWASGTTGVHADTLFLYPSGDGASATDVTLAVVSEAESDESLAVFWVSDFSPQAIPPIVPPVPDRLTTGQQIRTDQLLVSRPLPDGTVWFLWLQGDGNIVLEDDFGNPVWAAGTRGRGGVRLVQQSDGNLVLYRADGVGIWASHTSGHPGARFTLQTDGKAVVFGADNRPIKLVGAPTGG